ncbi:hypothetical protein PILCRDRAFT_654485 [Piloderma croceum F 1598]|uniref:Uncharacterized protein n=1 Tax=Piloderma croceum (strain F 1598) TaxID=765440 RepID=A0A0C3AQD0_PILCF|nr:hypothetical protein PILCRDRAFT_654485 [Piloderma croceum F 1598]
MRCGVLPSGARIDHATRVFLFSGYIGHVSDVCMAIYPFSQCIRTAHHLFNNLFQLTVRLSNALQTPSRIFHYHMLRSSLLHTVPSEISCAYGTKPVVGNEIHIFGRGPLSIQRSLNTPL